MAAVWSYAFPTDRLHAFRRYDWLPRLDYRNAFCLWKVWMHFAHWVTSAGFENFQGKVAQRLPRNQDRIVISLSVYQICNTCPVDNAFFPWGALCIYHGEREHDRTIAFWRIPSCFPIKTRSKAKRGTLRAESHSERACPLLTDSRDHCHGRRLETR